MRQNNYELLKNLEECWSSKNGILLKNASLNAKDKYWWSLLCGHSFQQSIRNFQKSQQSCQVCLNRIVLAGFNDFETFGEKYLDEWDYTKNSLKPYDVMAYSTKTLLWWLCDKKHSWRASPYDRLNNRGGCPYCAGRQVIYGFNDLKSCYPQLLTEWNYNKNITILPEKLYKHSTTDFWWICHIDDRHAWKESPHNRIIRGWNCPYCAGKRIVKGMNDLGTTHPELLTEWDYDKNKRHNLHPTKFMSGSKQSVWWKCSKGHSWKSLICDRLRFGCPYCSNNKVLQGYNDLATTHPELLTEWDYNKNDILPSHITAGTGKKIWWLCGKGHSWQALGYLRTKKRPNNCSICSNQKILSGYNDLKTLYPTIAEEWDYGKNSMIPQNVGAGTAKKYWWKCSQHGHSFQQSVVKRTKRKYGCPQCNEQGTSKLEKELLSFVKDLLPEDIIVLENDRNVIKPYELDIYIPALKIAIEFNGTYWHSDEQVMKNHHMMAKEYHDMKTQMCNDKNILLFHIFEKDWLYNNSFVKNSIIDFLKF